MKKLITEAQKHEIEELGKDHFDALIAYGSDLYREGIIKGAIIGVTGFLTGVAIGHVFDYVGEKLKNKKLKKEGTS